MRPAAEGAKQSGTGVPVALYFVQIRTTPQLPFIG